MNMKNIYTERLRLVPVTLEITRSLLSGSNEEVEKLGIRVDLSWPTKDTMDILPIINKSLEIDKVPSGFEFWMIVQKDTMEVVGDIGFHGKPNAEGEVEIGFGLVEQARKKGIGFEALKAIMEWLSYQESVKVVKADCLINNIPSAKILQRLGMKEISRDKDLIHWEFIK